MLLNIIPRDSILRDFTLLGRYMEAPYSYILTTALSGISCMLRRKCWFTIRNGGMIYPTLSNILIGPTGIGKDTAINLGRKHILDHYMRGHEVGGITSEGIAAAMFRIQESQLEDVTCGFICANEMKRLFGDKDYQTGMVTLLTDLMSEGIAQYEHGTKHNGFTVINPTLILQAGSTEEWFHQLPKDALAGGFIPRCLVVVERKPRAIIALPNDYMDHNDREAERAGVNRFYDGVDWIIKNYIQHRGRELFLTDEAKPIYENWYHNRYKLVSKLAQGYAHRARGHIVKIAMISAACRRKFIIDLADINFAIGLMNSLIGVMEKVILPPTDEGRCVGMIREMLPATEEELIVMLRPKFSAKMIQACIGIMKFTKEVRVENRTLLDNLDVGVV